MLKLKILEFRMMDACKSTNSARPSCSKCGCECMYDVCCCDESKWCYHSAIHLKRRSIPRNLQVVKLNSFLSPVISRCKKIIIIHINYIFKIVFKLINYYMFTLNNCPFPLNGGLNYRSNNQRII